MESPNQDSDLEEMQDKLNKLEDLDVFKEIEAQTQTNAADWSIDGKKLVPTDFDSDSSDYEDDEALKLGTTILAKPKLIVPPPQDERQGPSGISFTPLQQTYTDYQQSVKQKRIRTMTTGANYNIVVNDPRFLVCPSDLCNELGFLFYAVATRAIRPEQVCLYFNSGGTQTMHQGAGLNYNIFISGLQQQLPPPQFPPPPPPPIPRCSPILSNLPSLDKLIRAADPFPSHPFVKKLQEGIKLKHLYLSKKTNNDLHKPAGF
ncbi:putative phosphoprotein [Wuhan Louse Fly Virus 9]|uniref:Putative phosphoprotein n=1 Tax=Wuhan Louse Fly Virus 9 TaxID=1608123 RepID=A0A0B5KF48_9RHAB|nr:putative phosphoprotein [Wuhan Louse Fly Virus 9]AJG39204.1 putative phosphoprotein [Wuhan Louse Fly Virus 9]